MATGIGQHDEVIGYCRKLGHRLAFAYCRQESSGQPCTKIRDCWFETFDVDGFLRQHYSADEIEAFTARPQPKLASIVELIAQAQQRSGG